jgi:hypothetical protein
MDHYYFKKLGYNSSGNNTSKDDNAKEKSNHLVDEIQSMDMAVEFDLNQPVSLEEVLEFSAKSNEKVGKLQGR